MKQITTQKAFDTFRKGRKLPPYKVGAGVLAMMSEGLPPALVMTSDERKKAWQGVDVRPLPAFSSDNRPAWRSDADHAAFIEATRQMEQGKQMAKEAKAAARAESKPEKAKGPVRATGFTVQAIAEELKVLPRDARAALRAAKIDKPAGGWATDDKKVADAWREAITSRGSKPKAKKEKKAKGDAAPAKGAKLSKEEKAKLKNDAGNAIMSGKGKKEPAGKAPDAVDSKRDDAHKAKEVTAVKRPKNKDWVMRVDGALVKDENDKPKSFKSANECTKYAKAQFGIGVTYRQ